MAAGSTAAAKRLAVVGGGWAGLAAAVEGVRRGHAVTLFEMAPHLGGRARDLTFDGVVLDNGQHVLIGAYVEALTLMRAVGVDIDGAFLRTPLRLVGPDGRGLKLAAGAPLPAFVGAVLRRSGWHFGDRLALLAAAARWRASGFRCDPSWTVATLTRALPAPVRDELIEPLCVAALNTPAGDASAAVFLRVLQDALFAGTGSADLLLPRVGLGDLLARPAGRWLAAHGAALRLRRRVDSLQAAPSGWRLDDEAFDRVVLAAPPGEAARLVDGIAPDWARAAAALRYEPIVTVYLRGDGVRLREPMLALRSDAASAPAQFVFDRGRLGGPAGLLAFVISGARPWVERGAGATLQATLDQVRSALGNDIAASLHHVRTLTEKRATFRCTPGIERPPLLIAPGLHAAGDHVDGPYPATLEGAVRSGLQAVRAFG